MNFPAGRDPHIIEEVRCYLQYLKSMGCTHLCAGQKTLDIIGQWGSGALVKENDNRAVSFKDDIHRISEDIRDCRRCRLADARKAVVFGTGPVNAPLMFLGGFPEPDDDKTGVPYSGPAGELLEKIIKAMGFERQSVYICHAVKCRPADGRLPDRFEALACRTWLKRQIDVICPGLICTLGGFASQSLLGTDEPLSKLRGRFHNYKGIAVMPTHEPAYLLVHSEAKRAVWEDMKQVMACISH
jgi:DNA polymerase